MRHLCRWIKNPISKWTLSGLRTQFKRLVLHHSGLSTLYYASWLPG
jgi:hypothetical protein